MSYLTLGEDKTGVVGAANALLAAPVAASPADVMPPPVAAPPPVAPPPIVAAPPPVAPPPPVAAPPVAVPMTPTVPEKGFSLSGKFLWILGALAVGAGLMFVSGGKRE